MTLRRSVLMSDKQLNGIIEQFFDEFEDISGLHKSIIAEQGLIIAEATNKGKYGYVLIEQEDRRMSNYKEEFEHRKELCVNDNNFIIREIIDYSYKFAYFSWRKKQDG